MSGSRTSSSIGARLTKNSTISVTVDDFAEGVIVVSYPHQDNLFQGVLFELNRERGIPAGISFPKDYFTCESKTDSENDPSQIVPLTQRHTYFQDNSLGKQIRSLRRVIKTPARYKHSRMSLRPVQRPVLCAKCGSQCKEKSPDEDEGRNKTVLGGNDKETAFKSKSNNGIPLKKASTRNMKSETDDKPNSKESSDSGPDPRLEDCDDKKDYTYESVGSSTMVENVWRRPLAKPVTSLSRSKDVLMDSGTPTQSTNKGKKIIRLVPTVVNAVIKTSLRKTTSSTRNDNQNDAAAAKVHNSLDNLTLSSLLASGPVAPVPVFRISRSPTSHKLSPSTVSDQKTDNLKLCITKLKTTVKLSKGKPLNPDSVSSTSPVADSSKGKPPSELKLPSTQPRCRRRKRSSTYPIRPVDINSVKQSQPKKSKLEPKSRSRRKVKTPIKSLPVAAVGFHPPSPSQKRPSLDDKSQDLNGEMSSSDQLKPEPCLSISGNQTSKSSEGSDTGKHSISIKAEPTKTPVIKITFGSLGNGIVVQIPPKTTEEIESANISESKASRKAMKKAKKEARRKHLVSLITSPSSNNAFSPLTLQPNISQSCLSSPLLQMEKLPKLISEDSPTESLKGGCASTSSDPKKKHKKGKKKKKEKDHSTNEYPKRGSSSQSSSVSSSDSPLSSRNVTIKQKPSSPETNPSVGDLPGKSNQGNCTPTRKTVHSAASDSLQQGEKQTEAHHRLCISLRRLNTNAYIPWPSHEEGSEAIVESAENEDPIQLSIKTVEESEILRMSKANSMESFQDSESNQFYRKGDVIWGNSLGCLWWPGKIVDILQDSADGIRAKVSWYNAMTESFLKFQQLLPFIKNFDKKFIRSRSPNRGPYQQAVQNALLDAHNCNQEDLHHD